MRSRSPTVVQPTASTAPKNPAAAGTMPAKCCANSGTYMSTIVAAISSPIVTYIHFSGPGPNAARGSTVALARRSTTRNSATSPAPAARGRRWQTAARCTPATLIASAAAPSSSSDHTGMRGIADGARSLGCRAGRAPGTSSRHGRGQDRPDDPKAQRQIPNWAKIPPIAGPMITLTPHIADTSADALVHSQLGSAELITA